MRVKSLEYSKERFGWFFDQITKNYKRNRVDERASSLAFYMILSLVPIAGIIVFLGGLLLQAPYIFGATSQYVTSLLGDDVVSVARNFFVMRDAGGAPVGIVAGLGVFVLLYGATNVFYQLQRAFFDIFNFDLKIDETEVIRRTIYQRVLAFSYMILLFGFVIVLISIYFSISLVLQLSGDVVGMLPMGSDRALSSLFGMGLSLILFSSVYRFVSFQKMSWLQSIHGGFVAALLLVVANSLLSIFLAIISVIDVYGVAGSLVGFFLWSYYVMQILLIGAIVAKSSRVFTG